MVSRPMETTASMFESMQAFDISVTLGFLPVQSILITIIMLG